MPNLKQAEKRMRQSEKRRVANKAVKSNTRKQIKGVLEAVKAKDIEKAEKTLSVATKKLQKAAKKNIFHPNAASRTISRLSKKVNAIKN